MSGHGDEPRTLWTRSIAGNRADVLVGRDRLFVHLDVRSDPDPEWHLYCLDLDGHLLWTRPGLSCLLAADDDRLIASAADGEPQLLDADGRTVRRLEAHGVKRIAKHGDVIVLVDDQRRVWMTDSRLDMHCSFPWPDETTPEVECFIDGKLHWLAAGGIRAWAPGKPPEFIAACPYEFADDTLSDYRRALPPRFEVADQPLGWFLAADRDGDGGFYIKTVLPHLVLSLDRVGSPRWAAILGPSCCGGFPQPLPGGRGYAVSGGCNGIVSWLDAGGSVRLQSRPHEGTGLSTIYGNRLLVLQNGEVVVSGQPGTFSYDGDGRLRWGIKRLTSDPAYHPGLQMLIACSRAEAVPGEQAVTCIDAIALPGARR